MKTTLLLLALIALFPPLNSQPSTLNLLTFATPQPLAQAVASISARTPIGSALRSADWARVPLALRESSLFSATIESARLLQRMSDRILQTVKLERSRLADGGSGAFFTREKFIAEMRQIAIGEGLTPADPGERGTIRDITSEGRLGMIFDIQTQRAQGFAKWKSEQDRDVLDAYPAQELIRVESREVPRGMRRVKGGGLVADPKTAWTTRWVENGGTLVEGGTRKAERGNGRMVALKTDPIWTAISRFGTPWPPFDFNSGMGLVDISHRQAADLGLITFGDRIEPQEGDFTDAMQASVSGLSDRLKGALDTIFGDQVDVTGDVAKWIGGQA